MLSKWLNRWVGSKNTRVLKSLQVKVQAINALEPKMQALSDNELKSLTAQFKDRLNQNETLDDVLVEAFAAVREAGRRTLNMRHFDVQLIGGMVLHQGKIAEMSTGEGKTLVATLAAYLNALSGKGVHVITVNPYLAQRDAEWMRPLFEALDMRVGVNIPQMPPEVKKAAYDCDILYGTNNEFGFDYLRDKMAYQASDLCQQALSFAIVDEVDSILIDEARTPLIISGQAEDSSALYIKMNQLVALLTLDSGDDNKPGDFTTEEKTKQIHLTEYGQQHIEQLLINHGLLKAEDSLYNPENSVLLHHLYAALRAQHMFKRDVDYLIQNEQVVIVDEHTGRGMAGRRWSDGLHQAVEAKEGLPIQQENQTLASLTFQNYFRLYDKLSGMTGTADTEAFEFQQIYGLDVAVIPTHKPCQRQDLPDMVYITQDEKYDAIVAAVKTTHETGQPVLVGTISIENSEYLSQRLTQAGVEHQVLNAKYHEQEASIVAEAGRPHAVTIATNMAGRGTDIVLGGSREGQSEDSWQNNHDLVLSLGGLKIIGTERHESRRIDNQLRGRAARQGDPGVTQFFLALDDPLMRIFASEKVSQMMRRLGVKSGEAIMHPWISRAIENAQRKVEGHHFDIRKQLLEFDNVANDQRQVIYQQRETLLLEEDVHETIVNMQHDVLTRWLSEHLPADLPEENWDIEGLTDCLTEKLGITLPVDQWVRDMSDPNALHEQLRETLMQAYDTKVSHLPEAVRAHLERSVVLTFIDRHWRDHLSQMDHLRQSIHLRGYAQKDPKQEYKREAFGLFHQLLQNIQDDVVAALYKANLSVEQAESSAQALDTERQKMALKSSAPANDAPTAPEVKPGRNQPCYCGSGKKYKHCHGQLT